MKNAARVWPVLVLTVLIASSAIAENPWFGRVLVTNDDGIDDPRLIALARAFAEVAEVVVVAPLENCSGSAGYVSAFRRGRLAVEARDLGLGITAWGVDGFPGDCILLANLQLLKDAPVDLVVSGVNSGPNLADAWIASGTIGAARLAAHEGLPAIAFSSLDKKNEAMMEAVPRWCVELAMSATVRDLADGEYLNVNFPRCDVDEVKGVVWAAPGSRIFHDAFEQDGRDEKDRIVWKLNWWTEEGEQDPDGDVSRQRGRHITVTPLLVDEYDARPERIHELPDWD